MTQVTSKNMEVPMNINKKGKFFVKSHLKQMSVIKSAHNHRQCLYNNIRITQNSWKTSEASDQRQGSTRVSVVPRLSTKCTKEK